MFTAALGASAEPGKERRASPGKSGQGASISPRGTVETRRKQSRVRVLIGLRWTKAAGCEGKQTTGHMWVIANSPALVLGDELSGANKYLNRGRPGGSVVEHLPLAQGVIPGVLDRIPHWAPCEEPAYVSASLCVSFTNK